MAAPTVSTTDPGVTTLGAATTVQLNVAELTATPSLSVIVTAMPV